MVYVIPYNVMYFCLEEKYYVYGYVGKQQVTFSNSISKHRCLLRDNMRAGWDGSDLLSLMDFAQALLFLNGLIFSR